MLLGEQDALRPHGVEPEEAPRGHERQGEKEDASVSAPVRRLTRRIAEAERDGADNAEDHEMEPVVLDVRIELRPKQERGEPDKRQRCRDEPDEHERSRARSPLSSGLLAAGLQGPVGHGSGADHRH